jgi:ABC-type phosphate transport system substrate-binding protein
MAGRPAAVGEKNSMPCKLPFSRLGLLLAVLLPAATAAADYVVIVHPSNPVGSLARTEASRLFLRSSTRWPNGESVKPVDLSKTSAIRAAFTKEILGRSMGAIDQYWTQSVFSGRAVPPPEKRSDAEVVGFVRENPGAIGYVSQGASTDGVKRVSVRD